MNAQHTPAQDALCAELEAYCQAQGLPFESADELALRDDLTDEQRAWLHDFCQRWDQAEHEAWEDAQRDKREEWQRDTQDTPKEPE